MIIHCFWSLQHENLFLRVICLPILTENMGYELRAFFFIETDPDLCLETLLAGICSRASSRVVFQGSPEPSAGSRKNLISVQYYRTPPSNESSEPGSSILKCVFLYPLFINYYYCILFLWMFILNCVSLNYCFLKNLATIEEL